MNCLEFRSRLSTDPRDRSADLLAHRATCPACTAYAQQAARFEAHLAEAARLPVPPTLAARLVLNQTIHHTRRRRMLALAATVLLALGAGAGAWRLWRPVPLEEIVVGHVLEERELLTATGIASPTQVTSVLRATGLAARAEIGESANGASLPRAPRLDPIGEVRYAGVCPIGRHAGGHLVLSGDRGPITVLLLPKEPVTHRHTLAAHGFSGVILPLGAGSMAIIGVPGENLESVERRLQTALVGA